MYLVACYRQDAIVNILLDNEANVEVMFFRATILYVAIKQRNKEVMQLLLQHKANINAKNISKATTLAIDVSYEKIVHKEIMHKGIVRMFLEKGVNLNLRTSNKQVLLY